MLKLVINRKPGTSAIPAHVTTLGVSWLNRRFHAVAVHRGVVEGRWENPGEVDLTGSFDDLLREAVQKTGYTGVNVSLLLTYPRLVQQSVDLPPLRGALLDKLVARQAQQQKFFPGEAAWAYQLSVASKTSQRVILHLLPRALLDQLVQSCRRCDLHLMSVMPPSVVLQQQIQQLPLEKDQAVLLAAETGGSTTVVLGRDDGNVLMARTLPGTWNENAERLALDLNRTILFANEQYGEAHQHGIWIFGQGAGAQVETIQRHLQAPVRLSPVEYNPDYWATETPKLRLSDSPNFISSKLQKAPQRRVFATVTAVGVGLLMVLSVAAAGFLYVQARQEARNIKKLSEQLAGLQSKHQALRQRQADLERKRQTVKLIVDDRGAPVPVWLLGYLGEVVPPELVVTNLHIKRVEGLWKVQIAGTFQSPPGGPSPAADQRSAAVAELTSRLSSGPFHLTLLDSNREKESATAGKGSPESFRGWVSKLVASASATRQVGRDHFSIEGFLQ